MCASSSIGLHLAGAAQPRDEVALERRGLDHLHVLRVEARVEQALGHRARGGRVVAVGMDRADLDELAVDVARELSGAA
jgi:hypothetical protein